MEIFRQWLLGVTACAMLGAAAARLFPKGLWHTLVRFTGALLLLLAMLRPLSPPALPDWAPGDYRETLARLEAELSATREKALSKGIANQWAAYIEDKAEGLGVSLRAEVTLAPGGVLPEGVVLRGRHSEALSELLTKELGIAKEKQVWIDSG